MKHFRISWAVLILALFAPAWAQADTIIDVPDPDDGLPAAASIGAVEITCDGSDVTATIQACLTNAASGYGYGYQICKLTAGTCVVSNTLKWVFASGNWESNVSLIGAGPNATTLKLADNATGFTTAFAAKPVVKMCAEIGSATTSCEGNTAFFNGLSNLTIDMGTGNIGGAAVQPNISNVGYVRDVRIKGSGPYDIGLYMPGSAGPGIIENVDIDANARLAIQQNGSIFMMNYENIRIRSPIEIRRGVAAIRGLDAVQTATSGSMISLLNASYVSPPTNDYNEGVLYLSNSRFTSGVGNTSPAIYNPALFAGTRASILTQNVSVSGFTGLLDPNSSSASNAPFFATSLPAVAAFTDHDKTPLGLPFPEWPAYPVYPSADWQACTGCNSDDSEADDADAIIAALATGKKVVYVVSAIPGNANRKFIAWKKQINIPATTKVFHFMHTSIATSSSLACALNIVEDSPDPLWIVGNGWLRDFNICNYSNRRVILQDLSGNVYRQYGSGQMLMKDVNPNRFFLGPRSEAYAVQLNCESQDSTLEGCIVNAGGKLAIVGLKSESTATSMISTRDGGCTEVMGGMILSYTGQSSAPLFRVSNSWFSAGAIAEASYSSGGGFVNYVTTQRAFANATTSRSTAGAGTGRTNTKSASLMSAHKGLCPW